MDARETTIYHAILIAGGLIGALFMFMFIVLIRMHFRQSTWRRRAAEAEVNSVDQERIRIASDIHDELGPFISSARFQLYAVEKATAEDQQHIDKANAQLDAIFLHIRRIANDLMPGILLQKGPAYAIADFLHKINAYATIKHIHFDPAAWPPIPPAFSTHTYRILQELIHNTIKHAQATELTLHAYTKGTTLYIHCNDNGKGFHKEQLPLQKGMGWRNIMRRCELINARLYLTAENGTSILIEIPYP